MRAARPVPPYVAGHRLLEGKGVLVTAAAGTGIGFATATKCAEEGAAAVVLSDKHERRLGESVEELKGRSTGAEIVGVPCDVTVEADVQRLFSRGGPPHGRHRRGGQQRRPGRYGQPGRDDRRAVDRWSST